MCCFIKCDARGTEANSREIFNDNLLTTWKDCDILHKRVRNTNNKAERPLSPYGDRASKCQ